MSQHHSQAGDSGVSTATTRRRGSVGAVTVAALLTIGSGLAGCGGDDDDAADSSTTITPTASTEPPATTVPGSAPTSLAPTPGSTESPGTATDAGTDGSTVSTDSAAAEVDAALAAASTPAADTAPGGSEPDSGPTTTGPVCEFAENTAFPIQRCNMGPPVVVVQSILQAAQYDVSAIDGKFGDETIYAVRAFQAAEGLTVDGLVGAGTWAALNVPNSFGDDDNGNGSIEPNEIDLANIGGE